MKFKQVSGQSNFACFFKKIFACYRAFEYSLFNICQVSLICACLVRIVNKMKTYLKYSVLGRISEIREKSLYKILANSFFIGCLFNIINRICAKLKVYLETSKILDYKNMLAEKIFLVPVKMFSIILITVLPANIFLSLIFKINITFSGWIIRGILFFLAIGGISCDVCPEDIAKNSFITRNIIRHKNL